MAIVSKRFTPVHCFKCLLVALLWILPVMAIDSRDKWSSVYNSTLYNALPRCAQTCVASVDKNLNCWSYGCVCSENTPGENFVNGTKYVQDCVRGSCDGEGASVTNAALNAFQSLCGVPYFEFSSTSIHTATVTLTAVPTPTFDRKYLLHSDC